MLLTGGLGFIGSHTVEHWLRNTDWEIIVMDALRFSGRIERLTDIECYNPDRVKVVWHDLRSPIHNQLKETIGPVDYIVNMASDSHVDRSITHPVPFVQNNVNLSLNMLEYAREVQPEKFIQISTDEVYGPARSSHLHKEWESIIPSNPYAASKAAQEAIAISYWRTYGVPVIITNTMNNIGERQSPDKFVPMVIKRVLEGRSVDIHASNKVVGSRFYLHARNHASACLHLLTMGRPVSYQSPGRMPPHADRPDRWNIVGDREIDNLSLAKKIALIAERPLKYNLVDAHSSRPGHDLRYALDGSKMSKTGWVSPVSFDRSLERCVRWFMNNPEWLKV